MKRVFKVYSKADYQALFNAGFRKPIKSENGWTYILEPVQAVCLCETVRNLDVYLEELR